MTDNKQILVPLDQSSLAVAALPYAEALATATGAGLLLLAVVPSQFAGLPYAWPEGTAARGQPLSEVADAYLASVAANLQGRNPRLETRTAFGDPAEEILAAGEDETVSITVMATHGRGGLGRWALGSVADQVMRMSHKPTLLVHPSDAAGRGGVITFRRLLVPVDGSLSAEAALAPAAELAKGVGAALVLACVVPGLDSGDWSEGPGPAEPANIRGLLDVAEQCLARVRGRVPPEVPVQTVVLQGRVAAKLAEYSKEQGIDLVVMSTHGRSGLPRFMLGSTAERVVQAGLPTLLIHPPRVEKAGPDLEELNLRGYKAYNNDGEQIGSVAEVITVDDLHEPLYLVIDTGDWLHAGRRSVVACTAIGATDPVRRRVILDHLTRELLESGNYPEFDEVWWDKGLEQHFTPEELERARTSHDRRLATAHPS
jgi:nucleotide-binding universal stress UspA family protein